MRKINVHSTQLICDKAIEPDRNQTIIGALSPESVCSFSGTVIVCEIVCKDLAAVDGVVIFIVEFIGLDPGFDPVTGRVTPAEFKWIDTVDVMGDRSARENVLGRGIPGIKVFIPHFVKYFGLPRDDPGGTVVVMVFQCDIGQVNGVVSHTEMFPGDGLIIFQNGWDLPVKCHISDDGIGEGPVTIQPDIIDVPVVHVSPFIPVIIILRKTGQVPETESKTLLQVAGIGDGNHHLHKIPEGVPGHTPDILPGIGCRSVKIQAQ